MKIKKMLSLLLAAAMTASLPFAALATPDSPPSVDPVAKVNGTNGTNGTDFATLEGAVAFAQDGDTIQLLRDVENGESIVIDKSITLNFGRHTYKVSSMGSETCVFKASNPSANVSFVEGTVIAAADGMSAVIETSGRISLVDTVVDMQAGGGSKPAIIGNVGSYIFANGGSTTVKGDVRLGSGVEMEVQRGKFENNITGPGTLYLSGGEYGGDIDVDNIARISGGTFEGKINTKNTEQFITGGKFKNKPKPEYMDPGKMLDPSGEVVDRPLDDVLNENIPAPAAIAAGDKVIECADSELRSVLGNINLHIPENEYLAKVPAMTRKAALERYNHDTGENLDPADVGQLSLMAKAKLMLRAENITDKGFDLTITPSTSVYVENKTDNKAAKPTEYVLDNVSVPVHVSIPITGKLAVLKKFTVTHGGKTVDVETLGASIEVGEVKSFADPFKIKAKAAVPNNENEPMPAPTAIAGENKTVECTDRELKAALEKMNVVISDADFLAKVPSMTKKESLDKYNNENQANLTLADVDKLSVTAKKKLVISAANVTSKGFDLTIAPAVSVYVENKSENKTTNPADYRLDNVGTPVNVTIPLSRQFADRKEFAVTYNGNTISVPVSNNSITINNVSSFASTFNVSVSADNEIIPNKDISVSKPVVTEISTNNLSKSEKALAEAINRGKIKFTPDLNVNLNNVNITKEQAVNILRAAGITADINSNITMRADIKVVPSIASVVTTEGSEGFTLNLNVTPELYVVLNGRTRAQNEALVQNSGIALANKNVTVTVPLSSEFSKIKESRKGKFTVNNINDTATSNSVVEFETSNPNGRFAVRAPQKDNKPTPPPATGDEHQITVLDGTYKIKNKELIKTDRDNTVKFDESAYLVVVKGGYSPKVDAKDVAAEDFLTKDDVKKLRIGTVKFEENGKLVDGKISWQARMIKVNGKNRGVYLIEIPIKKNSGYTSSQDVFGNFELRASKPYFFGADETKENVNFYVDVDADVNSGTDEIYDGTHVYEFNDMEDDEITLYGGDGTFIVDTRGQGKLVIKTDVKYNKGIEKANPNANYVYYNSNYPTFNRLGYLYLKANRGDRIYKVDKSTGRLTKMSVPYDRDMEAFKIRTRTLGCYVVAERELDLDKINGIIDPQPVNPVKPPVAPPSIINPPTGANI